MDELLSLLERYTCPPDYPSAFGARVYKITRDAQGDRLTCLKVTGGAAAGKAAAFRPRRTLGGKSGSDPPLLRARFTTVDEAPAGTVCAVTGLSQTRPGEGLGGAGDSALPLLEPVLTYRLILPPDWEVHAAMERLSQLEEEDPQLHFGLERTASGAAMYSSWARPAGHSAAGHSGAVRHGGGVRHGRRGL